MRFKTFIRSLFYKKYTQWAIVFFLSLLTLLLIVPSNYYFIKRFSEYGVFIMMCIMASGFFFMIINIRKLMFSAFICVGILCLYFKYTTNYQLKLPETTDQPKFHVVQMNVSSITSDRTDALASVLAVAPEIISLQEVTPDWIETIDSVLSPDYPYKVELPGIDLFGLVILSQKPIVKIDTFYFDHIPNVDINVQIAEKKFVHIISFHTYPPLDGRSYEKVQNHLKFIGNRLKNNTSATIALGDYNLVSWSSEIKEFRNLAELNDSRRDYIPSIRNLSSSLFFKPVNHIFYNKKLECIGFMDLYNNQHQMIGIMGKYQYTRDK